MKEKQETEAGAVKQIPVFVVGRKDGDGKERLVRAHQINSALKFVALDTLFARRCTVDDAHRLGGTTIEDATKVGE